MKAYVDSNVFISIIKDEFGGKFEFMSYRSKEFFRKVIECLHTVVISDVVIKEISKKVFASDSEIRKQFIGYEDKIIIIAPTYKDLLVAEELNRKYKIGKSDILHFLLAKKLHCDCIVTWNKKDFKILKNGIKILEPHEL